MENVLEKLIKLAHEAKVGACTCQSHSCGGGR